MREATNKLLLRLGLLSGIILTAIAAGYFTGNLDLVFDILAAIALVLIGITVLVTVHEMGHFLAAKAFGMRVEVFSIGFPPKLFSFQRGETEYQIGATPLGGYVKISGIIDESLDTKHLGDEPEPWEFRAKPVWQRLIVMVAGVVMNILLGIAIFSGMKFTYGEEKLPIDQVQYGIEVPSGNDSVRTLGHLLGFRTGDELVSFKGQQFPYFEDYARQELLLEDEAYYEVRRNGELLRIDIPGSVQNLFSADTIAPQLFLPNMPAVVMVQDSSPAALAGIQTGDQILALDSTTITYFSELTPYLKTKPNEVIRARVKRGEEKFETLVSLDQRAILGVARNWEEVFTPERFNYGIAGAIKAGTQQAFSFLSSNVQGFKNLARKDVDASKSVMGPLQIARVYLDIFRRGGIPGFLTLTAMLSMILAFVNILPIPALDGGHVVFLLIEGITRREPSPKVRIIAQQIGMFLIVGLMLLILFNDVVSFF